MKSNETKLGTWIRDGLKAIRRNQVWLAEKIGVQPPQVSRIISGASEATPELLSAIADALGKPRIQAYRAAGYLKQEAQSDEWVEEQTHKLKQIPPELRSMAAKAIEAFVEEEPKTNPARSKTKLRAS